MMDDSFVIVVVVDDDDVVVVVVVVVVVTKIDDAKYQLPYVGCCFWCLHDLM